MHVRILKRAELPVFAADYWANLRLVVELSRPTEPDGTVLRRRYDGLFPDQETAYLAASYLWSGPDGHGASSAALVAENGVVYPIDEMATTCGLIDKTLLKAPRATVRDVVLSGAPAPP